MIDPPRTYSDTNDRANDPWDHDAVCWMVEQLGTDPGWTYHNLFECARKQRNRIANDLDRVIEAANICGRLGVQQIELQDHRIGKRIVRLRRTDDAAPAYPTHYDTTQLPEQLCMSISDEDRRAAERLLRLLGSYEAELRQAGKTRATINTYVDRAERFLKRVASGGAM